MKKITLNFTFALLAMCMVSTAHASLKQFVGQWKNNNANTRGITKIHISNAGRNGIVNVRAWGQCHPTDCDWGSVKGYAYGPNVSSNIINSAKAVSAIFNQGFSQTLMIMHPKGRNRLRVEVFTRFTDNSQRNAYQGVYTFVRSRGIPPVGRPLPAPRQISPRNRQVFHHFPRKTTVKWRSVQAAKSYTVEVDCFHCCTKNRWCTRVGKTHIVKSNIRGTQFNFNWVGAQKGRWRVWAVDRRNQPGRKSPWRTFSYTR
jgi:hypothetical protein